MTTFVGIDPGVSGAIASIRGADVEVFDCPVEVVKRGKKNRRVELPHAMAALLSHVCSGAGGAANVVAYVERVGPMPRDGSIQAFTLGRNYGSWVAALAAFRIRTELPTPAVWKRAMLLSGQDKDESRLLALRLYPSASASLRRKKDHGRAEALLLAEYGRRLEGQSFGEVANG
jgi:crossover junction endodeoxyribonuclease RuvC